VSHATSDYAFIYAIISPRFSSITPITLRRHACRESAACHAVMFSITLLRERQMLLPPFARRHTLLRQFCHAVFAVFICCRYAISLTLSRAERYALFRRCCRHAAADVTCSAAIRHSAPLPASFSFSFISPGFIL
jgi:hypothetical protein